MYTCIALGLDRSILHFILQDAARLRLDLAFAKTKEVPKNQSCSSFLNRLQFPLFPMSSQPSPPHIYLLSGLALPR